MKFYKNLRLNKNSAKSLELTLSSAYDGQIIMDVPDTSAGLDLSSNLASVQIISSEGNFSTTTNTAMQLNDFITIVGNLAVGPGIGTIGGYVNPGPQVYLVSFVSGNTFKLINLAGLNISSSVGQTTGLTFTRNPARNSNLPLLSALRIPTGTGNGLFPAGTPQNQRPKESDWYSRNGLIRYNITEKALEVLTEGEWIQLRRKTSADITIIRFGAAPGSTFVANETYPAYEGDLDSELESPPYATGCYVDGIERNFGPIYDLKGVPPKSAANIMVYMENVFQIPFTNYKLLANTNISSLEGATQSYIDGMYVRFQLPPPPGKTVTVIMGFD